MNKSILLTIIVVIDSITTTIVNSKSFIEMLS